MARVAEGILKEYNLQNLSMRANFDGKGFVKQNLYGGSLYRHHPSIKDFWEDCVDENKVLRRDYMRLTLK